MVDETSTAKSPAGSSSSATSSEGSRSSDSIKTACAACTPETPLEEEAFNAVREASFAVKSIAISEMLPRTPELLFLNLTTLEGQTYCVELCTKGYRVASARQDCMNGDFRQLGLHTRYFESIYELLNSLSPAYRDKFATSLASKLANLQS